jgi:FkbM family methyltransferase
MTKSNRRKFVLTELSFAGGTVLMESFDNPWGSDDPITDQICKGEFDEQESLRLWAFALSTAPAHTTVLDVGAFAGLYSLLAARIRPDARSVAFEPATMTYGRLTKNILWNKLDTNVVAANLAVSDTTAIVTLPHAFGLYTLSPGEKLDRSDVDHTEAATTVILDALMEERSRRPHFLNSVAIPVEPMPSISAIKIDVEGHEPAVLRGGLGLIRKFRPILVCEYWDAAAKHAIENVLAPEQYAVSQIEDERNVIAIPQERHATWHADYAVWKAANAEHLTIEGRPVLTFET